jgi:hypothetical protein
MGKARGVELKVARLVVPLLAGLGAHRLVHCAGELSCDRSRRFVVSDCDTGVCGMGGGRIGDLRQLPS